MKSFIQFLEERKVDPVRLAKRVARRYGKRTDYPGYENKPDYDSDGEEYKPRVGKHIPLRRYDAERADAAHEAFNKHRGKSEKGKTFQIKDLHPIQPFVRTTDRIKLRQKVAGTGSDITIATHKGRHYIMNGHHEIMGAAMRGEKEITATSYRNLDGKRK
jgi:hypothetical protein